MKAFICLILGHNYTTAQTLTPFSRRVYCKRCCKSFAMSDNIKSLVPWNADFHKMYEEHGVPITYLEQEKG